jgi:hypothetical protein
MATLFALIKAILFSRLRNEEHHEFLVEFRDLITLFKDVAELLTLLLSPFDELLLVEESLLEYARKSVYTEQIVEADKRLDRNVRGLKAAIVSALSHFDPAHVQAAKILYNYLKPFGNISHKSYEAESAAIQKLVRDMLNTYAPQIAILGLGAWIEEINLAEISFTSIYTLRSTEQADRSQENIHDIRLALEAYYEKMTTVVKADVTLNGPVKCGEFILRLNNRITHYNDEFARPTRYDIIHAVAVPILTQKYTGKAVIPIPEVHYVQEGKPTVELVFSVDFTVTYKENVNVGDAELIIHGKGKYKGAKTITFNIERTV